MLIKVIFFKKALDDLSVKLLKECKSCDSTFKDLTCIAYFCDHKGTVLKGAITVKGVISVVNTYTGRTGL